MLMWARSVAPALVSVAPRRVLARGGVAEQLKACGAQLSGWGGFPRDGGGASGLSCSGGIVQLLRVLFQLLRGGGPVLVRPAKYEPEVPQNEREPATLRMRY